MYSDLSGSVATRSADEVEQVAFSWLTWSAATLAGAVFAVYNRTWILFDDPRGKQPPVELLNAKTQALACLESLRRAAAKLRHPTWEPTVLGNPLPTARYILAHHEMIAIIICKDRCVALSQGGDWITAVNYVIESQMALEQLDELAARGLWHWNLAIQD